MLWGPPPPNEHPKHWHRTGFFATIGEENLDTKDALAWIRERRGDGGDEGRKLVYFGQGSFDHHDRETFTDVLLDAMERLDMDAIVLASTVDSNRLKQHLSSDRIKIVGEIDQDRVFPLADVLVHHGGAGSTSQVLRTLGGKPSICVPAMPFQEIWGGQIRDYGAGLLLRPSEMLAAWNDNESNLLADSIQRAISTPSTKERARELSETAHDRTLNGGVELAADLVVGYLRTLRWKKLRLAGDPPNEDCTPDSTVSSEL